MNFRTNILAGAAAAALFALPVSAQVAVGDEALPPIPPATQSTDPVTDSIDRPLDGVQDRVDEITPDVNAEAEAEATLQAEVSPGEVVPATSTDLRAGAEVRDLNGGVVGTVESVDAAGVVVSTGSVRAQLPAESFGKNDQGLVVTVSRAELEAAASAPQADTQ